VLTYKKTFTDLIIKLSKPVKFAGMCIFSNKTKSDGRRTRQVPPQTKRTLQNTTYKP
jgi:hypothetical protein